MGCWGSAASGSVAQQAGTPALLPAHTLRGAARLGWPPLFRVPVASPLCPAFPCRSGPWEEGHSCCTWGCSELREASAPSLTAGPEIPRGQRCHLWSLHKVQTEQSPPGRPLERHGAPGVALRQDPLPCFESILGPRPGARPPGGQTARTVAATGLEHARPGTWVTDPSVGILSGPSPHTDQNLLYQESMPQRHQWLRKKEADRDPMSSERKEERRHRPWPVCISG